MTEKEISKFLVKCEFSGDCDHCEDPKGITWAVGYAIDECGEEVDSYACTTCAEDIVNEQIKSADEFVRWYEDQTKSGRL